MAESQAWPTNISLDKSKQSLSVEYDTGESFILSAEYLRTHSQSAEVKGHGKGQEILVTGKKDVLISTIETICNYAIKITFSDGHDTGLYSWKYLFELGENQENYWQAHLEKLKKAGAKR